MRIYVDESGTHGGGWLIIGMLFVPDHGLLHSELLRVKDQVGYHNASPRHDAKYKETHLSEFKSQRDVDVASGWIDSFLGHSCFFRSIVVDWSIWEGKHFGTPFEADALKKRRAYKKWAEMLLHPESLEFRDRASLYLDRLRIAHHYDVLDHLKMRFSGLIQEFQETDSAKDANQCLQLCDLLTGGVYQSLVPAPNVHKRGATDYLYGKLTAYGVKERGPVFWRGYHKNTLRQHFPKFSEWFWKPEK